MRRPTLILVAFKSATGLAAAQGQIKVKYDPRPDADISWRHIVEVQWKEL